ncbi:MAG: DegT/DnrJ/EryC1/StrS family aminotransferase [Sneathiella sp.]
MKLSNTMAKMPFVESKRSDMGYIAKLLEHCIETNLWANRGPLYHMLAVKYEAHMNVPTEQAITPCANGGIGLEALARFLEIKFGKPIRWAASSFSFSNLGRGYFSDMQFVDCTKQGILSLEALEELYPDSFDGFVVTNPFGAWPDFDSFIDYAEKSGKFMLIDNAAGLNEHLPKWPYQSFSLHHTKPYGAGEGGLILSPKDEAESIYNLLNYGSLTTVEKRHWINNGKVSDIACAFQIDRLDHNHIWKPLYLEQTLRIIEIAAKAGLKPLYPFDENIPVTSLPFCAAETVLKENIDKSEHLVLSKYYLPLAQTPSCLDIFDRLVNIPCHPDVALVKEEKLFEDFSRLTEKATVREEM